MPLCTISVLFNKKKKKMQDKLIFHNLKFLTATKMQVCVYCNTTMSLINLKQFTSFKGAVCTVIFLTALNH